MSEEAKALQVPEKGDVSSSTSSESTAVHLTTEATTNSSASDIKLGLPKGRMFDNIKALLSGAGIDIRVPDRGYRPQINLDHFCVKLLKPQNVIEMMHSGSRDLGFGGRDWVVNLGAEQDLVELLDTGMDKVRVVAAALEPNILEESRRSGRRLRIASEYELLTKEWIKKQGLNAQFVRAFGATESFPPEDADLIVDNTATGSTLSANGLTIVDTLLESSTRLYANRAALADPAKKAVIDNFVMLLQSVLTARSHMMLVVNVSSTDFERVIGMLPFLKAPSVQQLHSGQGFAISVCVEKHALPLLLPKIKAAGATDMVVTPVSQIIL